MTNATIEIIDNSVEVVLDNTNVDIIVSEEIVTVELGTSGPQGATGAAGASGAPGQTLYSDLSYVHTQNSASATWTITHNLQFIPSITVVDSGGTVVEGSYNYPNSSTVVLTFSAPFSGKAYLS